ncbi:MAG: MFS transporter [Acidimicrobiia bacterium]|nr:MFS transporter [Acidimicrobiia bacterium]
MVGAAFASMFAVFGVAYSFGAFFDSISEEFDVGSGVIALFFALTTFLYFTLGLVTGRWSDRVGPKPVLLTGAVAVFVGLMITSVVDSLWIGLASYSIGVGIAVACGYVPMVAVVGGWFEERRTLALGVAVAGIGMGTLVMAPTASWLIDEHEWRVAYRILAVGASAVLLLCAVVTSRPPVAGSAEPSRPLGSVVQTSAVRALYGSTLLLSLALFVPFVFVADYAEENGIDAGLAALLVGLIGGASIVGRLGLGTLAPRVGLVRLYQSCFAAMAASFLLWLVAGDSYPLLVLFALVFGIAYGGFIALAPAVAAEAFGTVGLGGVLGAIYTAAGVGGLIGPPLAGAVIDATDGYTATTVGAMLLALGAFVVTRRLPAHR